MVKLILTWDIKPGRDQEYFEFIVREFGPGMKQLGLQLTSAWLAIYGECPQILMEGSANDLPTIRQALTSAEWQKLHERLLQYVDNYQQKIVRANGKGFQL